MYWHYVPPHVTLPVDASPTCIRTTTSCRNLAPLSIVRSLSFAIFISEPVLTRTVQHLTFSVGQNYLVTEEIECYQGLPPSITYGLYLLCCNRNPFFPSVTPPKLVLKSSRREVRRFELYLASLIPSGLPNFFGPVPTSILCRLVVCNCLLRLLPCEALPEVPNNISLKYYLVR